MPKPLDSAQAADLAGISTRAMFQQAASDYPPQKGAEGYPCREFGAWLKRRHLRGIGVTVDGVKYDLDTEKARLTHHQANIAALNEGDVRGSLIPAQTVAQEWQEIADRARMVIESIPARLAARFGSELEHVARLIVAEVLEELDQR